MLDFHRFLSCLLLLSFSLFPCCRLSLSCFLGFLFFLPVSFLSLPLSLQLRWAGCSSQLGLLDEQVSRTCWPIWSGWRCGFPEGSSMVACQLWSVFRSVRTWHLLFLSLSFFLSFFLSCFLLLRFCFFLSFCFSVFLSFFLSFLLVCLFRVLPFTSLPLFVRLFLGFLVCWSVILYAFSREVLIYIRRNSFVYILYPFA